VTGADPRRGPGRPRDPAVDAAVLDATLTQLADHGDAGLTTDAIAAAAGVGKASIYRRWASKDELVLAAVASLAGRVPSPDTGSLQGDLTSIAAGLVEVFSEPRTGRLVGALIGRLVADDELARRLRGGFLTERRAAARSAMERGRERGEVRDDVDLGVAVDLLAAPFYYRLLVTGQPVDDALARDVVAATLTWLERPPPHT
jgi:AcrR family transcriptional regulator